MRFLVAVAALGLAACSGSEPANTTMADVNGAAEAAQGDIDTYAANTLAAPRPVSPTPTPTSTSSGAPARPGAVSDPSFAADSAKGAADVVQRYFALIEAKNYDQAWGVWGDDGRASGMTRAAFAASFAKYGEYHAEVGAPGDVDAGAGQRHVTVPVRAYGTLTAGRQPFEMRGTVTLHRTDVDGAGPQQRMWRISDAALKPRALAALAQSPAYACDGATRISVRPTDADAPGIWYRDGDDRDVRCTAAAN